MGMRIGDMLDNATPQIQQVDHCRQTIPASKLPFWAGQMWGNPRWPTPSLARDRNIVSTVPGTTRDPVDSIIRYHGEELGADRYRRAAETE